MALFGHVPTVRVSPDELWRAHLVSTALLSIPPEFIIVSLNIQYDSYPTLIIFITDSVLMSQ